MRRCRSAVMGGLVIMEEDEIEGDEYDRQLASQILESMADGLVRIDTYYSIIQEDVSTRTIHSNRSSCVPCFGTKVVPVLYKYAIYGYNRYGT